MELLKQVDQTWELKQLQDLLTEELLPQVEALSEKKLILPGERGKAALGPFPPRADTVEGLPHGVALPEEIAKYTSHRHVEWAFGYAGKGELALDGQRYTVQRGDLAIIPSNVPHLERIHDPGQPYHYIWFCMYNQLIRIHAGWYSRVGQFEMISGASIVNCAEICRLFLEGTEEALARSLGWRNMLCARASEALVLIARHIGQHGLHSSHLHQYNLIQLAKAHIEKHYAKPLTLKGIAQRVYLSPNYFSTLFSQNTGKTVVEYIQAVRLNEACRLLRGDEIPIHELAGLVGFHSSTHFTRSFKRHTGISPSAYRQRAKGA